jgi:hypothetical protein
MPRQPEKNHPYRLRKVPVVNYYEEGQTDNLNDRDYNPDAIREFYIQRNRNLKLAKQALEKLHATPTKDKFSFVANIESTTKPTPVKNAMPASTRSYFLRSRL